MDMLEVSPVTPVSNQSSLIMTALGEGAVEMLSVFLIPESSVLGLTTP